MQAKIRIIIVVSLLSFCMSSLVGLSFTCDDMRSEENRPPAEATDISLPEQSQANAPQDSDSDGLTDLEEQDLGTNYLQADSDNDGILDKEEAEGVTSPIDSDTDNDGLSDLEEAEYGTDPERADTDGDTFLDGEEVRNNYDPLYKGR
ncbi:hypothetical protein ACFL2B_01950 [Patescibacteria group bacterium]